MFKVNYITLKKSIKCLKRLFSEYRCVPFVFLIICKQTDLKDSRLE